MKDKILLFLGLVFLIICLFLWQIKAMLTAFAVGLVIAYLLNPLVDKLKIGRTFGSLLLLILFYCGFLLLVAVGIPLLLKEGFGFLNSGYDYAKIFNDIINQTENWFGVTLSLTLFLEWIAGFGQEFIHAGLVSIGKLVGGASAFGSMLSLLLITPLVAFYMLQEWPAITKFTHNLIPLKYKKETLSVLGRIDGKLSAFVRGQLLICSIQGVVYGTGLWLIGVKMGFLLGMLTGLLSFIPVVGGLLGFAITMLVAVVQYKFGVWIPYALIAGVFAFGSLLESFILTPKIMGDKVGLHPVWIMFALLAGGQIAGIIGMLVAVPVASIVSELLPLTLKLWRKSSAFK